VVKFTQPLVEGRLLRRYKRFLADVELADGAVITCHCPNTGSMLGCADPGLRVWLSRSDNPKRKYAHTWELVETSDAVTVGIHTGRTNDIVAEAIRDGHLPELSGYGSLRREVTVPDAPMRADFLLSEHDNGAADCFVEAKNVTAAVEAGIALFPDAVSARGTRHLEVLAGLSRQGGRAALVFCVQRGDVREVRPADEIDPEYGRALRRAISHGVEVFALCADVSPAGLRAAECVPVVCP
jgi:sugar fermentation stimulation protein A